MRLVTESTPTLSGALGKAWHQDVAAASSGMRSGVPIELTIASWIVHAPYAHPWWCYYWIGCVSLRDMEGAPPAVIHLEGGTHEILLFALNPDVEPAIDQAPEWLEPANFVAQFIATSDEAAAERVRGVVQDVVDGRLHPDTDFISQWVARFGGSSLKEHREPGNEKH